MITVECTIQFAASGFGIAPNNGVTPKQKQDCLKAWSNSTLGKSVQFFSLYNLATNLSSLKTWAEWTVLPAAKIGAFAVLSKMSSAIGGTREPTGTPITSPCSIMIRKTAPSTLSSGSTAAPKVGGCPRTRMVEAIILPTRKASTAMHMR